MADQQYIPGAGDVEIELGGKSVFLKPTLEAALRLSRGGASGPRVLAEQCMALNFDAVYAVIAAGLGRDDKALQVEVFETGIINLFGACVRFVHIVSNGGRPSKAAEDENEASDPLSSASPSENITAS
jgi:hypothetical protein